tara:strand:- start:2236 stop:2424 length:189 start_codon:yes stop_codon:yes gene_type:complete
MEELQRFKEFLSESNGSVIDKQWIAYVKSLVNDIRINGVEQYKDFDEEDILEDFENYVADKM